MSPAAKTALVKALARGAGFDLVGITRAAPLTRADYYRRWLAAGYGGTMAYLARNVHFRTDPRGLLPGSRSIICVAAAYRRADGYVRPGTPPGRPAGGHAPAGRVAQYARGRDYHTVLKAGLRRVVAQLRERLAEPFEARIFVDTGPLLERELAAAAGLGWLGKNTCLLNAARGSYLLLGEILTTLVLDPDDPVAERCAACTRCLDACPTGALIGPQQLDATRCISYLTIEHRGPVPEVLQPAMGEWVFGCDICQQVCPYNARAPLGGHPELSADCLPDRLDLLRLVSLGRDEHRRLTRGTAATRGRPEMWRRNAAIALGNVAAGGPVPPAVLAALRTAAADGDAAVRAAAAASLGRLGLC